MPITRSCLLALLPLVVLASCGKKAEREWSPADHDHLDESPQQPESPQAQPIPTPAPSASALADGARVWQSTCSPCHGPTGKGDGPAGRALRVPNLSTRQASMSDQQLAEIIKNGRGQMPAFGSFPPELIDALVKKIRTLK